MQIKPLSSNKISITNPLYPNLEVSLLDTGDAITIIVTDNNELVPATVKAKGNIREGDSVTSTILELSIK